VSTASIPYIEITGRASQRSTRSQGDLTMSVQKFGNAMMFALAAIPALAFAAAINAGQVFGNVL
jgi:hypothetical protein